MIEIFGSNCIKCERLQRNVHNSLVETGISAEIREVKDPDELASLGVMTVPTLMIDGQIVSKGRNLSIKELNAILTEFQSRSSNDSD